VTVCAEEYVPAAGENVGVAAWDTGELEDNGPVPTLMNDPPPLIIPMYYDSTAIK